MFNMCERYVYIIILLFYVILKVYTVGLLCCVTLNTGLFVAGFQNSLSPTSRFYKPWHLV